MNDLKIIEPIQNNLKHFNSTDEFSIYYSKHKDELDNMTTQKLNKQFTINGYRITKLGTRDSDGKRIKGSICLKKVKDKNEDEIKNKIYQLELQVKAITETLNNIIEHINS